MDRYLALFSALFLGLGRLSAQCCCSDILVHISLEGLASVHSEREFEVRSLQEHGGSYPSDRDSTDNSLLVSMDAGCGLAERRFTVTRKPTGERMELSVLFIGFDGVHPSLRIPFTPGEYDVDLEHVIGCANVGDHRALAPNDTLAPYKRVVHCGNGNVRVERNSEGVVLELLDLRSGAFRPGQLQATPSTNMISGYAEFPGGTSAFQAEITTNMVNSRQPLPARSVAYKGIGCVQEQGTFYARIDHEQIQRAYNVERALMNCEGWSPARVLDTATPAGWRPVRSMVRFAFSLDGDR